VKLLPVVILAGGRATRLRPLTESIPKSLIEIAGEPFIAHQLRLLRSSGIREVVLCTGFMGNAIREYVGDGSHFGVSALYSDEGDAQLGTGAAVRKALPLLQGAFFVLYGDSYLNCDYAAVQRAFEQSGRAALMTVFANAGQWDTSNAEFVDGKLLAYDKRNRAPRMKHIDYGLGVFRREAWERYPEGTALDLAQVYQDLLAAGDLAAFEVKERFYEIGSFSGIEELRAVLALNRIEAMK
jgi:MurNAc alpha-1-phosphate uridylyltransferase